MRDRVLKHSLVIIRVPEVAQTLADRKGNRVSLQRQNDPKIKNIVSNNSIKPFSVSVCVERIIRALLFLSGSC